MAHGAIDEVNRLVEQIAQAATQQSSEIDNVHQEVSQLDASMTDSFGLVNESAEAAASLMHQAHDLVGAVSAFKLQGTHP